MILLLTFEEHPFVFKNLRISPPAGKWRPLFMLIFEEIPFSTCKLAFLEFSVLDFAYTSVSFCI